MNMLKQSTSANVTNASNFNKTIWIICFPVLASVWSIICALFAIVVPMLFKPTALEMETMNWLHLNLVGWCMLIIICVCCTLIQKHK
jgi:uncharacterized membrane protein